MINRQFNLNSRRPAVKPFVKNHKIDNLSVSMTLLKPQNVIHRLPKTSTRVVSVTSTKEENVNYRLSKTNTPNVNLILPKQQNVSHRLPQIAATLQHMMPSTPGNLLEIMRSARCRWCDHFIPSLKAAVAHYNSDVHQHNLKINKYDIGSFDISSLSQSQLLDIEQGLLVCADGPNTIHFVEPIARTRRETLKLVEHVDKLDLNACNICSLIFSNSMAALRHYAGKKHKQKYFAKMTDASSSKC